MSWIMNWATRSNEAAVCNARVAATALASRRVEREEVALFLAAYAEGRASALTA